MSDDIETLRGHIFQNQRREALAALERVEIDRAANGYNEFRAMRRRAETAEKERDCLQGRVATLQKALDDHFAADKRAAKAIFTATGRKWGFPDNKEVVAFYVAEVERLEKGLSFVSREGNRLAAKLERAKEAIAGLLACPEISDCDPRDKDAETQNAERKARAVLSELSADAPAQQTQISGEVREAMVEAEKAQRMNGESR